MRSPRSRAPPGSRRVAQRDRSDPAGLHRGAHVMVMRQERRPLGAGRRRAPSRASRGRRPRRDRSALVAARRWRRAAVVARSARTCLRRRARLRHVHRPAPPAPRDRRRRRDRPRARRPRRDRAIDGQLPDQPLAVTFAAARTARSPSRAARASPRSRSAIGPGSPRSSPSPAPSTRSRTTSPR